MINMQRNVLFECSFDHTVTLEHKAETLIFLVWKIFENLVQNNLNIEKIIFKVVQMKFLAMHVNNQ